MEVLAIPPEGELKMVVREQDVFISAAMQLEELVEDTKVLKKVTAPTKTSEELTKNQKSNARKKAKKQRAATKLQRALLQYCTT